MDSQQIIKTLIAPLLNSGVPCNIIFTSTEKVGESTKQTRIEIITNTTEKQQ